MPRPLMAALVTLGDPEQLTGGYLYHRRLVDLAPAQDARLRLVSFPEGHYPRSGAVARRLAATLLADPPDVLAIDSIVAAEVAPALDRLAALPLVGSLHQPPGGVAYNARRARRDLQVWRAAALLLVASDLLAEQVAAAGLPVERIEVVPPGRDVAPAPDAPAGDLRQGRAAALLCVANWLDHKGILALLDALARLPPDAATLHLIGRTDVDAAYTARVRERLAAPGLSARVVVHGPQPPARVAALYRAADVFVLPSTQDAFATVHGEAMALGLPVVGVRAGNLPNLASDGVEGRIVPVGDPEALAAALLDLATHPARRRRMGRAALARASARPTWADTAARFFTALRAVASGSTPSN